MKIAVAAKIVRVSVFFISPLQVNRFQLPDYVFAAAVVAESGAFARRVQVHADPAFELDLFEYPVAGGKIDVSIAQIVDAGKELRLLGIFAQGFSVVERQIRRGRGPPG